MYNHIKAGFLAIFVTAFFCFIVDILARITWLFFISALISPSKLFLLTSSSFYPERNFFTILQVIFPFLIVWLFFYFIIHFFLLVKNPDIRKKQKTKEEQLAEFGIKLKPKAS